MQVVRVAECAACECRYDVAFDVIAGGAPADFLLPEDRAKRIMNRWRRPHPLTETERQTMDTEHEQERRSAYAESEIERRRSEFKIEHGAHRLTELIYLGASQAHAFGEIGNCPHLLMCGEVFGATSPTAMAMLAKWPGKFAEANAQDRDAWAQLKAELEVKE